ncbi:MAG: DUF4468 domain-containing protein [Bacteroidales bacterium]|nr:DUF4468 domain-containing protein [Bacteroidales bacterium]
MKKVLIIIPFLFIQIVGYSQKTEIIEILKTIEGTWQVDSINNSVYIQEVVEVQNKTKEQIYYILHDYLTMAYGDANKVIQMDDREKGLIVCKGIYAEIKSFSGSPVQHSFWHIIKFEIKEGKVRITINLRDIDCYISEYNSGTAGYVPPDWKEQIIDYYPINTSKRNYSDKTKKTREGYIFYRAINRAWDTMGAIKKALLSNDNYINDTNDNW